LKKALIAIILISVAGLFGVFLLFRENVPQAPDTVLINDAVITAMQNDDITESMHFLSGQLNQIFEDMDNARRSRDRNLQIFLYIIIGVFALTGVLLYLHYQHSVIKPFRKLQSFARHIAAGNFDVPLDMDKSNMFGAFTESFDLMRDELKRARETERKTEQSKKELVASLSHDIKTPVASIKAVTELMLLTAANAKEVRQLEIIGAKAEQINSLITNIFHATLEELQALNVTPAELESTAIPDLISIADYEGRVTPFSIPNCIVLADTLRLGQVFDNIISNSYKYAKTDIEIKSFFDEKYLVIEIIDFGKGVQADELPLILNKFYRGKDTETKSGYGLGLFISNYFLEKMSGKLLCQNLPDGFAVSIMLRLA